MKQNEAKGELDLTIKLHLIHMYVLPCKFHIFVYYACLLLRYCTFYAINIMLNYVIKI